MAPLTEAPLVPDRGREMELIGDMEQAGRSASTLGAERNSAELRSKAATPVPLSRDSSGSTPQTSSSSASQLGRKTSTSSLNRRYSHVPVVSSPLNPSSSTSSVGSGEDKRVIGGSVSPMDSSSSGELPGSQSSGDIRPKARRKLSKRNNKQSPAQQLLRLKSAPAMKLGDMQGQETPKHLKDLGRDYSRYPISSTNLRPHSHLAADSDSSLYQSTTSNPFSDPQGNIEKWSYPDDSIGAFDPYYGGEKGFILYMNEVEADDKYHMPHDDDDITYKPKLADYWDRRSMVSAIGGFFLILGLLCVFIVFPVLTFATKLIVPQGDPINTADTADPYGPAWAHVNNNTYALLNNVRRGLIDPDTPASAKTRTSTFDGSTLNLVFSDEFNHDNRTFYPGDDPYWTAPNFWYGATQDLEWYNPVAVTTANGTLQLRMDAFANHNLPYQSGMLNSWNQLCFKGGVFEVSLSLAGPSGVPGLWPGVWTMGNLGRPGYRATTDGVWPYTYESCDIGITPNQSDPDGLSFLPGQKLSSCTCSGEDHPNPGTGRGAPEIDILEASVDPNNRIGVVTQSFQVAPFDVFYRPNSNFMQIPNYETTQMNGYCGGPYQQAISGTTLLNNEWYDSNAYQKYAFEYVPGTSTGKIAWFVGEDQTFMMDGLAIGPNGNVAARQVSEEPMSMVLNLGISGSWSEILFDDLVFPTIMYIDYVRIYQKPGQTSITCDPPGYPTTDYIANHADAYNNPNLTVICASSPSPYLKYQGANHNIGLE
jgi:beta-glucanase (GH16 family)